MYLVSNLAWRALESFTDFTREAGAVGEDLARRCCLLHRVTTRTTTQTLELQCSRFTPTPARKACPAQAPAIGDLLMIFSFVKFAQTIL